MITTATIAKTSLVVRISAALAEDQWTLRFVVTCVVASGAFLLMSFAEGIIGGQFVEYFLRSHDLWTKVFLRL